MLFKLPSPLSFTFARRGLARGRRSVLVMAGRLRGEVSWFWMGTPPLHSGYGCCESPINTQIRVRHPGRLRRNGRGGNLGQVQTEGCDCHLGETGTVSLGANISQWAPCVIGADHFCRPKAFHLGFPRVCGRVCPPEDLPRCWRQPLTPRLSSNHAPDVHTARSSVFGCARGVFR